MNRPTDTVEVRRANLSLVLQALDENAPCSRTDIREVTGLVSASVSSLVDDLIERGLVVESGEVTAGARGRPRRVLRLNPSRVVCVTVQVTDVEGIGEVRDLNGRVRWQQRILHGIRFGHSEDLVRVIAGLINEADAAASSMVDSWKSMTVVAVPGPIVSGQTLGSAITFGLGRTELAEPIQTLLNNPVDLVIMNDGRLGALAEYGAIAPRSRPQSMVFLSSQDGGVGGGLVIDGEAYLGSHLMAGECGHICVDMNGPRCGCGARGCLTLYLGADRVLKSAGLGHVLGNRGLDTALSELVARLEAGDEKALAALQQAGRALAAAVGTMSNYTDLDLVVLGGVLPQLGPWIRPTVDRLIKARSAHITEFNPGIAYAHYGEDTARVGAGKLARQSVLKQPDQVPVLHHLPD